MEPALDTPDSSVIDRLMQLLLSPRCQQLRANGPDQIFYIDTSNGLSSIPAGTVTEATYLTWLDQLVRRCDVGLRHGLLDAPTPFIEGSFMPKLIKLKGSIHIATSTVTHGYPALTLRKQPDEKITLAQMVDQRMMDNQMRFFLELAMHARLNILISGGSGAGKTTLARALSLHIDPSQRVCTCEEIDELNLAQHLPDVVPMTTVKDYDDQGVLIKEITLEHLVRETLRMRPDRIWVGETRGKEAYALVKACNSGHDGSATTVHGDNGQQAVKQLVSYVMESHLDEHTASDQVARAFHLVVQISKTSPTTRLISEIVELEPVREGHEQRRNPLFQADFDQGRFLRVSQPTQRMVRAAARYGIDIEMPFDHPERDPAFQAEQQRWAAQNPPQQ